MSRIQIMVMSGGFIFAVLLVMIFSKMSKHEEKPVAGLEVLVASRDLSAGYVLKEEDTRWEAFPENAVYNGLVQRRGKQNATKPDVYDKPLKRDILSGEPITSQALVDANGGSNMVAVTLHPGMRAVAISVRPETMAGGFITPGDYVDVILNFQVSLHGDPANFASEVVQNRASETILSNVLVLAVDQSDKGHEAKVGRTITLEVSKKDAQTLAMASSMGELSLALRKFGEKDDPAAADSNEPLTTDINVSKVIRKIYNVESQGSSKGQDTMVRIYSGGSVTNIPVRSTHADNGGE